MAKEYKPFAGVVNYVSMCCPYLQTLLMPIYDLTRKGRPFIWDKCIKMFLKKLRTNY